MNKGWMVSHPSISQFLIVEKVDAEAEPFL